MLLWFVIALGFLVCVAAWHLWQGISWEEALILFIAAAIVFAVHLKFIYNEATTDHYLVSGYVTSLVHHPAYSYAAGKIRHYVPEGWIIEQRPRPATQQRNITYSIRGGQGLVNCRGECLFSYTKPPYADHVPQDNRSAYAYPISVDQAKFIRTKIGDTSAVFRPYFNPVQISADVVYNDGEEIPYFKIDDYNRPHRIVAPVVTQADEQKLENINAELSQQNISVGLIVTSDNLYFEKLKRAWHQGKANDFVIVVNALDGKTIQNVNVLGWNNYKLKESVAGAITALPSTDIAPMLSAISDALHKSQDFTSANFSQYHFLDVKIPDRFYWKIIIFQAVFFAYMLTLLCLNPNTKDKKLPWGDAVKMWNKNFRPPNLNWHLHPFTPFGLFLYIGVPFFASRILFWYN